MTDHGDAAIHKAQNWLARHFSVANPIEQAARISGIPERSFKEKGVKSAFSFYKATAGCALHFGRDLSRAPEF